MASVSLSVIVLGLALVACGGDGPAESSAPAAGDGMLRVLVVNEPLRYFAERLGGDAVRVSFPAPSDVDPAFWSPDPAAIAEYQQADLILLNGAGYAKWVQRVTLPDSKLVATSRGFADRYATAGDAAVHTHGPDGEHSHGEIAFTTWLDPTLATEQAAAVRDALVRALPARKAEIDGRFEGLAADLGELDRRLATLFAGTTEPILGSHPVYQYLARRYELNLRSVHFEPDEQPDDAAWRDLETLLVEHPAQRMLWEAEPLPETRSRLEGLGIESVVFAPCGATPEEGDFLSVMLANAGRL